MIPPGVIPYNFLHEDEVNAYISPRYYQVDPDTGVNNVNFFQKCITSAAGVVPQTFGGSTTTWS